MFIKIEHESNQANLWLKKEEILSLKFYSLVWEETSADKEEDN